LKGKLTELSLIISVCDEVFAELEGAVEEMNICEAQPAQQGQDQGEEKPPVLKRRD